MIPSLKGRLNPLAREKINVTGYMPLNVTKLEFFIEYLRFQIIKLYHKLDYVNTLC